MGILNIVTLGVFFLLLFLFLFLFLFFELNLYYGLIFIPELLIRSKCRENKTLSASVPLDSRERKALLGPSVSLQEKF